MTPYTDHDLETDLRAALDTGNPDRINALAAEVDRREQAARGAEPTLHEAALWYATQQLPVFCLQPRTKIPFKGTRGCKDATLDPDQITAWWTAHPDANIGLATGPGPDGSGGVDVVDIDGPTGHRSRLDHWNTLTALTVLAKVTTPRPGGMHLYVPATNRGNKAGLLPGIDYRSAGGYVVAPPSITDQGTYRFLTPLTDHALAGAA